MTIRQDHSGRRGAGSVLRHDPLNDQALKTSYTLSPSGQITDIGGAWDEFAWEHGAFEATADLVIGHRLNEYLDGFETVSFLNALTFACRKNQAAMEMICRCDSARQIHLYRMHITPKPGDMLEISHTLLLSRDTPEFPGPNRNRVQTVAPRCAMCCNYRIGRAWVDPMAQLQVEFSPSTHLVCPDCKARARDALRRATVPTQSVFSLVPN